VAENGGGDIVGGGGLPYVSW